MLSISTFASEKSPAVAGIIETGSIESFVSLLQRDSPRAWSPAIFEPPHRKKSNVTAVHLLVYDIDGKHKPSGTIDDAVRAIEGFSGLLYTTRSHTPERHSFRLALALSRPLLPAEYETVWSCYAERLATAGVTVDGSTRDPSRLWFGPGAKAAGDTVVRGFVGVPVDVDGVLDGAPARVASVNAARLRNAKPGSRNTTLFKEAARLGQLIEIGRADEATVRRELLVHAEKLGLGSEEAVGVIERGIAMGRESRAGGVKIVVDHNLKRIVDESVVALVEVPGLYARGTQLVRLVVEKPSNAPRLLTIGAAGLREALSGVRTYARPSSTGVRLTWAPDEVLSALQERGAWDALPAIAAISRAPTISASGEILGDRTYDAATATLVVTEIAAPVDLVPTHEDAFIARKKLERLLQDFPFASNGARSAAVAFLLTVIARPAFAGPAPLFVVDGSARGVGKSLLVDVISVVATGAAAPKIAPPPTDEELQKQLGAVLSEGAGIVVFDNVVSTARLPSLDAAITTSTFKYRLLGKNQTVEVPVRAVLAITGNNLELRGDLHRRAIPIRLASAEERPELRQNFRIPDIVAYARRHRTEIVAATLTIIRAHALAGRPAAEAQSLGSFEGWSRVIASAIKWAGGVDPLDARIGSNAIVDHEAEELGALLEAWDAFDVGGRGSTAREAVDTIVRDRENHEELSDAIAAVTYAQEGRTPDTRALGRYIRRNLGRPVRGREFKDAGGGHGGLRKWSVVRVGTGVQIDLGAVSAPTDPTDPTGAEDAGGDGGFGGDEGPHVAEASHREPDEGVSP